MKRLGLVRTGSDLPQTEPCTQYDDDYREYACPPLVSFPAGDLDDDGADDLFTTGWDGSAWHFRARSGVDGRELWSAPMRVPPYGFGRAFMGRADITGDATPEIVLLQVVERDRGVVTPVAGFEQMDLTQYVRTLAPETGRMIWEHVIPGRIRRATGLGEEATDFVEQLDVLPDASGDGRNDLVVSAMSWGRKSSGDPWLTVRLLDGVSGEEFSQLSIGPFPSTPFALPSGDLSGDGLGDIVAYEPGDNLEMRAYSGRDARPLWAADVSDVSGWGALLLPLDGEVGPDILVSTDVWQGGKIIQRVVAIQGTTGRRLWTLEDADRPDEVFVAGDIDRDGGNDIIRVASGRQYVGAFAPLVAYSGATGLDLWRVDQEVREVAQYSVRTADLTGDGVLDFWMRADGVEQARDGRDCSLIWVRPGDGGWVDAVGPPGDVNGNGTSDLYSVLREGEQAVTTLLDGRTAAPIWSMTHSPDWSAPSPVFAAGRVGMLPQVVAMTCAQDCRVSAVEAWDSTGRLWHVEQAGA